MALEAVDQAVEALELQNDYKSNWNWWADKKLEERIIILITDAIIKPFTMMIKTTRALVASLAMPWVLLHPAVAYVAVKRMLVFVWERCTLLVALPLFLDYFILCINLWSLIYKVKWNQRCYNASTADSIRDRWHIHYVVMMFDHILISRRVYQEKNEWSELEQVVWVLQTILSLGDLG